MKHKFATVIGTLVAGSAIVAASLALKSPPLQAQAPMQHAEPATGLQQVFVRTAHGFSNGAKVDATVMVSIPVLTVGDHAQVRIVAANLAFQSDSFLLKNTNYMRAQAAGDSAEIVFGGGPIDPAVATGSESASQPVNYQVHIRPKQGRTWGTIDGEDDLDVSFTEP